MAWYESQHKTCQIQSCNAYQKLKNTSAGYRHKVSTSASTSTSTRKRSILSSSCLLRYVVWTSVKQAQTTLLSLLSTLRVRILRFLVLISSSFWAFVLYACSCACAYLTSSADSFDHGHNPFRNYISLAPMWLFPFKICSQLLTFK